ncbi:MAG: hypothetical protein OCD01_15805 [Fibrobacterales bacterium]
MKVKNVRMPYISVLQKKVLYTFFCFMWVGVFGDDTITCRGNYFLDIESTATKRDLLYCFVDSDAVTGFEVRFVFDNAAMQNLNSSALKNYTNMYVQVPSMAELATGLTLAAEEEVGLDSVKAGSDFIFQTSGTVTSGSTSGLLIKVVASWVREDILLAGFYKDNVSVSISALP